MASAWLSKINFLSNSVETLKPRSNLPEGCSHESRTFCQFVHNRRLFPYTYRARNKGLYAVARSSDNRCGNCREADGDGLWGGSGKYQSMQAFIPGPVYLYKYIPKKINLVSRLTL